MDFRGFITNSRLRRQAAEAFERLRRYRPAARPSRRLLDKLVARLLLAETASAARYKLSAIGAAATPALAAALEDHRYHRADWLPYAQPATPLDAALGLLAPHAPAETMAIALRLVESPSASVRKTAALHLASLGKAESLPTLVRLLDDTDEYVRSYVCMGIQRAIEAGTPDEAFRRSAYDALLARCDRVGEDAIDEAPEVIVALDQARAASDFSDPRWFTVGLRYSCKILESCTAASIPLPEHLLRSLLEGSLAAAVGEDCYPHQHVASASLGALVLALGGSANTLLVGALEHPNADIQGAAARGLARVAGLDDPLGFVFGRLGEVGWEGLTVPQRNLYCAFMFDAEVRNGGLMQFFGNPSGDLGRETLEALGELSCGAAKSTLSEAVRIVGPFALEPNRDRRLSALGPRYDELQAAFEPIERAYYDGDLPIQRILLLYALAHAPDFRDFSGEAAALGTAQEVRPIDIGR